MLVIYDCDGVLVDSEMISSRVMGELLTDLGYPITAEECRARYTGISLRRLQRLVEGDWGRPLPDDFQDQVVARDKVAFAEELQAVPHIADAAAAIDAPRCVASSGTLEKIRRNLDLTGLLTLFDPHLFSAWQVERGKPAPDLFLFAANGMDAKPGACVVVEDSVAGIQGAKAAGMRVLGFAGGGHCGPGYAEMLKDAGADAVFDDMRDLPALAQNP